MIEKFQNMHEEDQANFGAMLGQLVEQAGFTASEWSCIADITNGTMIFDPLTLRNIHGDIEDAEDCFFAKWEVSREDILAKFKKLDSLSRLAIAVRCRSMFEGN
jgi:hypothetical protein